MHRQREGGGNSEPGLQGPPTLSQSTECPNTALLTLYVTLVPQDQPDSEMAQSPKRPRGPTLSTQVHFCGFGIRPETDRKDPHWIHYCVA